MKLQFPSYKLCVAPMMEWTDRHCRFFHRLLAPHARLYTEMVTTGALLHGNLARHLDFSSQEHPVALQIGGSDPVELAAAARLGQQWGYDEINLNCGCPSPRVQRGAFGACLMAEPQLVAQGIKAMRDAVDLPITIKHRLGIDAIEEYAFVRDFVGVTSEAGCQVFIVHARNAILKGLSPKKNREVPPLKYAMVYQLKKDFPHLTMVLNGGLQQSGIALAQLEHVDGVMLGRQAYHCPRILSEIHQQLWPDFDLPDDVQLIDSLISYAEQQASVGIKLHAIVRHILGLMQGRRGARAWRQRLSDSLRLSENNPALIREAYQAVLQSNTWQSHANRGVNSVLFDD